MTRKYNQDLFERFNIPDSEAEDYSNYVAVEMANKDPIKEDCRFYLVYEARKASNLEIFLSNHPLPDTIKNSLRHFAPKFSEFLADFEAPRTKLLRMYGKLLSKAINGIFTTAFEITGTFIPIPDEILVQVIKGIEPSSLGGGSTRKKRIISMQSRHLDDPAHFLTAFIHECVCHRSVIHLRKLFQEIFNEPFIYPIEEGFVKTLSKKIYERITGYESLESHFDSVEINYPEFRDGWENLNPREFAEWYKDCLTAIKERMDQ
jgi:hypothetical protein